jgi:hypothetical protein
VYPAAATQALIVVEPVALPVPVFDGHAVHGAKDAAVALYVDAAQAVPEPV